MDQLSIDYAQEALREFSVYAERIEKATHGQLLPRLVIYADGSGHIFQPSYRDIGFSTLESLAKLLAKKNGATTKKVEE